MTETHPAPPSEEQVAPSDARVSTKRGRWSVILALGSAAVFLFGTLVFFAVLPVFGTILDPDFQAAARATTSVTYAVMIGMLVGALWLGIASIVGAARRPGRAARTNAIVLGCTGILISALIGIYILLPWLPI